MGVTQGAIPQPLAAPFASSSLEHFLGVHVSFANPPLVLPSIQG